MHMKTREHTAAQNGQTMEKHELLLQLNEISPNVNYKYTSEHQHTRTCAPDYLSDPE